MICLILRQAQLFQSMSKTRNHSEQNSHRFSIRESLPKRQGDSYKEYLYGILPVQQALIYRRRKLKRLLIKEEQKNQRVEELKLLAIQHKIPIILSPKENLSELCSNGLHQGVVLECGPLPIEEVDFIEEQPLIPIPIFLALDQIEDPHNLGAIIRSCGFFNVNGIILVRNHSCGITPTVSKTSAGVTEGFPILVVSNLVRFLENQKQHGYWVIGLEGSAPQEMNNLKLENPIIIVVGNEGRGLRQLVRKTCDCLVKISGDSRIAALNVSNATAIVLYQLRNV